LVAEAQLQPDPELVHSIAQAVAAAHGEDQQRQRGALSLAVTILAARVGVSPIRQLRSAARNGSPLTTNPRLAFWLPSMLRQSDAAAARLVHFLPPSDRDCLSTLALSLARLEHEQSLLLPTTIMRRSLALLCSTRCSSLASLSCGARPLSSSDIGAPSA
jgi:hypothetical protein